MNWIKLHWKEILIFVFLIFAMNKCTQSCSRGTEINTITNEYDNYKAYHDSIEVVLNDSIKTLNTIIQVYEEKITGLNQALSIQDEANRRISEAKKNINVQLKQE